jgi:hypothetical protein
MKTSLMKNESGVALVTALLVLMLTTGLMAGMFAALLANQRSHSTDRDQSVAYAAAHAGLEKLTSGLAALFATDFSPSAEDLDELSDTPPAIDGFEYVSPGEDDGSGYAISFNADDEGNPAAEPSADITTGPFEGFKGLITPYTLTVTARSITGNSEVRLRRELQTVAVPVFQFGIFGEKGLGFHAGPNFDFGGRVHTNESLYLAAGGSAETPSTLTFRDKITAVTQVVRHTLSNGAPITNTGHPGNVSIPKVIGGAPSTYRLLKASGPNESSGTMAAPWSGWKNLSEVTYKTNIRTEATGAKRLVLPLATQGAAPIDLIRRPLVNSDEDEENPSVYGQRYFAQASLRILLSDRIADITNLPSITAGNPLQLDGAGPAGYAVNMAEGRTPIATSPGELPFATISSVPGTTLTRVSAIQDADNGRLTIQAWDGDSWEIGVPQWMKQPAAQALARGPRHDTTSPAVIDLPCTGVELNLLTGCNTTAGTSSASETNPRHGAYSVGQDITIALGNGTTVVVDVTEDASANSAEIKIAFDPRMQYGATGATRHFYIGEDPVFCHGFRRAPASTGAAANVLTGCTLPNSFSGATVDVDAAVATGGITANDPIYMGGTTTAGTPLLNGFIKIEKQDEDGDWTDVTAEILNLGFSGPNLQGDSCGDPSPNAVLRFQRYRDNAYTTNLCGAGATHVLADYSGTVGAAPTGVDFVPNILYDAREGHTRLQNTGATDPGIYAGGLFGYVALDINNLRRWFLGEIGTTGDEALNNNGYIIYFSDRRGDHNEDAGDVETGEYGHEDSINPGAFAWSQTSAIEVGEDFNENGSMEDYGEDPHPLAVPGTVTANLGFTATQRPWQIAASLKYSARARTARPVLFRRALKLVNAGMNLPEDGLTVTAENPIYVQGNYNATQDSVVAEPNRAAAIIGDSITLLSRNFNDAMTMVFPHTQSSRPALTTGYRFAMVTGKTIPFPRPSWADGGTGRSWETGSDGGVHNFMKMLENWGSQTLRYRGSMVSLYYSRQATGMYRADGNIYGAPTRAFNFDTDFLTPTLLPPGTPMFRDINTLKFRQILRPNQ